MAEARDKMGLTIFRIAGMLATLDYLENKTDLRVNAEHIDSASKVCRFFLEQYRQLIDSPIEEDTTEKWQAVLDLASDELKPYVTATNLYRRNKILFKSKEEASSYILKLKEEGSLSNSKHKLKYYITEKGLAKS